jgi:hypothetical protein
LGSVGTAVIIVAFCCFTWLPHVRDCLPSGDSGELIVAAATGVAPHPPGYPLFTWLYHLVSVLARDVFYMSPTLAMNRFTAVLSGAAALLIAAQFSAASWQTACVIAMLWASTPTNRMLATQTEVFALHHCTTAFVYLLFDRWWRDEAPSTLRVVRLAAGCAAVVANQHAGVLAIFPVMVVVAVATLRRDRAAKSVAITVGGCVLAVCGVWTLALVGIAALQREHKGIRYGWGDNAEGLAGALRHFLRANYGTFRLHGGGLGGASVAELAHAAFQWLRGDGLAAAVGAGALLLRFASAKELQYVAVYGCCAVCSVGGLIAIGNIPLSHAVYLHVYHRLWAQAAIPIAIGLGHAMIAAKRRGGSLIFNAVLVLLLVFAAQNHSTLQTFALPATHDDSAAASLLSRGAAGDAACIVEAFALSATAFLPQGAVVYTLGDVYLTALRYGMAVRRRDRGAALLHVDRELLSYKWAKRWLVRSLRLEQVPAALMGEGYWTVAHLADAVNAGPRRQAEPSPIYLLETTEFVNEKPSWKDTHAYRPEGWFYRLVPKATHRANCSGFEAKKGASRQDDEERVEAHVRRLGASDAALDLFARLAGPAALGMDVTAMAELFPWESLVLQQYYVARKNLLLQAAVDAQDCLGPKDPAMLVVALKKVQQLLVADVALKSHFDHRVFAASVTPFVELLKQHIEIATRAAPKRPSRDK